MAYLIFLVLKEFPDPIKTVVINVIVSMYKLDNPGIVSFPYHGITIIPRYFPTLVRSDSSYTVYV